MTFQVFKELGNKSKNSVFLLRLDGNEHIQDVVFQILWNCYWLPSSVNVWWAFYSHISPCCWESIGTKYNHTEITPTCYWLCYTAIKCSMLQAAEKRMGGKSSQTHIQIWHQATTDQVTICQWVMCNVEYRNEEM